MAKPKICLLEDDAAVLDSVRLMLERNGFSVRAFHSPNDLLLGGDLDSYDCLVLDIRTPGMTGMELLELLRARAYSKPAILISASGETQLEGRMRKAGVSSHLLKPIAPNILLAALYKATGQAGRAGLRT
jgi:FixJ family two-component response regulator